MWPPVDPRLFAQSVENLRKSRLRPERDLSVAAPLRAAADELRRSARGLGNVGSAWADLCPPTLVARTRVESLHRATLTIAVDDTAAKYVLDRWLREGGESVFLHACGAAVRRIKLVVGAADPASEPPAKPSPPRKRSAGPSPKRQPKAR